jgi:aminobenzoyl-glutamate utilization protein B
MSIYNITDPHVMETSLYEDVSESMIENGVGLFSTDSADPSWIAPMGSLFVSAAPIGSSVHSWQFAVCSGMSIGHKAMEVSGKTLALTAVNIITREEVLAKAKAEHKEKVVAKPYINPLDAVFDLALDTPKI